MQLNEYFDKINNLLLDKSKWCSFGTFYRAFIERSNLLTDELFPYISTSLEKSSFQLYVTSIFNKKLNTNIIYDELPDLIKNHLIDMKEIMNNSYKNVHGSEDNTYITSNHKHYYIGALLFENYMNMKNKSAIIDMKQAKIIEEKYNEIKININNIDSQFKRYKLLSLNDNIYICNDKNSQTIVDKRIGAHFWIPVPQKLLTTLQALIDLEFITNISFRIDNITDYIPFFEDMERGSPLKLDVADLPPLSKFYSVDNYADSFWVHHDSKESSITFEELRDDFQIIKNDIITQVIHLKYSSDTNGFYIHHLDHELISYTLEQYEGKIDNPKIKGYKKTKSFKIDNAKIPFIFKNKNELFLFQVLDSYFKNSELISEYFHNIK